MTNQTWDLDAHGNVRTAPLIGWTAAPIPMALLLRVEYVTSDEQLAAGAAQSLQLAIGPAQARQLAQALLKIADKVDQQPLGTRQ